MSSRWMVTGCRGQLGRAFGDLLASDPERVLVSAVDLPEVDVADRDAVQKLFGGLREPPDFVVNAAAFTHVDRCEREPDAAHRANAVAPGLLAEACRQAGAQLVHVSTDYVFPGDGERPYTEEDPPAPRSEYGRSKLEGELRVADALDSALIVRSSWVFGHGRNFIAAILAQAVARREARAHGPLQVVDDQRGRPTYAVDLAAALVTLLDAGARGLYHVTNGGVATWWEVARASLDAVGFEDLEVERIATSELDLPAPRPVYSVLDCSKAEALGVRAVHWRMAVQAYLRSDHSPLVGASEAR